jgi:geranylgeranyl reductase family protein
MNSFDLIVVGAGPAGAVASYVASKHGLRTLLLEKEKVPRHKPCAGALSPKAAKFLRARSLLDNDIIENTCERMEIIAPNVETITIEGAPIATLVERSTFDMSLVLKAEAEGVNLADGERVTGLRISSSGAEIKTTKRAYSCKVVIGADGVNSMIARLAGLRREWNPNEIALAMETRLPLDHLGSDGTSLKVYFGDVRFGYGWLFPKREFASIGLAGRCIGFENAEDRFRTFVGRIAPQFDAKQLAVHACAVPLGGAWRKPKVYGERVLLAGDAAGFADPWIGEGIYYALVSGEIAADTVVEAAKTNSFSQRLLGKYWQTCRSLFWRDLKDAFLFARMFHSLLDLNMAFLEHDRTLRQRLFPLIAGETSYRRLLIECATRGLAFLPRYYLKKLSKKIRV